ncbi:hypothetical protein [Mesorhizobium sp. L2C066B000]|uniref:hypothetical protein n=1 Tax=Mesorhizobium sp. L2C066B000 TaxID=1287105 RepID=UPI0003D03029|nr:hypothetical protein [Mesorhizobium sp. L2C066B000]ESZ36517.1 hypothetical protein X732_23440 [Mesorhizobium sp. L2C066B000]
MQISAGLLANLGDSIEAIAAHIATMETRQLHQLLKSLPSRSEIASAEMVMGTLVYREIELRRRRGTGGNVLPFPGLVTPPIQQ